MSDLTSSNNVATNSVKGIIGNKTWPKCETSVEGVCFLEIPEICKPRFSRTPCFKVCRSDPYFAL